MPLINFTLKRPSGEPYASTQFAIESGAAGGVSPLADPILITTNSEGEASVTLEHSLAPYFIHRTDETTDGRMAYKFFVPDTDATLNAQMLLVDLSLDMRNINNESLAALIDAKVSLQNRMMFLDSIAGSGLEGLSDAAIRTVDDIASLKLLGGSTEHETILRVAGYYTPNDGGGGDFWWDATSTETDNKATIVKATDIVTGRWKRLLPGGYVSLRWFGAKGDGVTDDALLYQDAINYAVTNNVALYVPKGVYLIGPSKNYIQATMVTGSHLTIYGDGPAMSIIKESPDKNREISPGTPHTLKNGCKLLFIKGTGSTIAESVMLRDICFDKDGGNTAPPTAEECPLVKIGGVWVDDPNPEYYLEHSHAIMVQMEDTALLRAFTAINVTTRDIIGAGINLAKGLIIEAVLINCHGIDHNYTGGPRGDHEFQATVANLLITGCTGDFIQSEPNISTPVSGIRTQVTMVGCRYTILDVGGFSALNTGMHVNMVSCYAENAVFYDALVQASLCDLGVASILNSGSRRWFQLAPGSSLSDCRIRVYVDAGTNALSSWYMDGAKTTFSMNLIVSNCHIEGGTGMLNTTTGFALYGAALHSGVKDYSVRFIDCTFDPLFEGILNADRNGVFEFTNCKLACRSTAFKVGSSGGNFGKITLTSCDLSGIGGVLVDYRLVDTTGALVFNGNHLYSKFDYSIGLGTLANAETCTTFNGVWTASGAPTGPGIKGQVVSLPAAAYGAPSSYLATVSSDSAATWVMKSQNGVGRGSSRPSAGASDVGLRYQDTALASPNGKPIEWNGSNWIDYAGSTV